MRPDFGKPTKLSQMVLQEITILSIDTTIVLSCYIVAMLGLQYNQSSLLVSVL